MKSFGKWSATLFQRRARFKNIAVERLYRQQGKLDPKTQERVDLLPQMAEVIRQGGDHLYQNVLVDLLRSYDLRFGSDIAAHIDEPKKRALLQTLTSLMLFQFFNEIAERYPGATIPSSLTEALHVEIYGALPAQESFIDYLSYRNPNFEDPKAAPAFKFGADIAGILETLDLSFSFMVAQQFPLVRDVARGLIRLVLFNEPIETAPKPS